MIDSIVKASSVSSLQDALALYEDAEERVALFDANRGFYYGERIIVIIKSLLAIDIDAIDKDSGLNTGRDILNKDSGNTPLHYASGYGYIEIVEALIIAGANINAKSNYGTTALMNAAHYGNPETVKVLIDRGANVNAKRNDGETAFSLAGTSEYGDGNRGEIQRLLKKAGARE